MGKLEDYPHDELVTEETIRFALFKISEGDLSRRSRDSSEEQLKTLMGNYSRVPVGHIALMGDFEDR